MNADFFTEIGNDMPYLHAAFQGFAGSGKTHTASLLAIGIHLRIKSEKPVVIFDTEGGTKFLKPLFDEAGIKVLVKRSRTLSDLRATMKFCEDGNSDVLLIDSISHVWEGFLESYKQSRNRKRLEFQDWGVLKPLWKREFSDPFVSAKVHITMCGRAGYEYETVLNEETNKREIFKSGIKMKVEGETAYEPDVLVLMERYEKVLDDDKQVWREATFLKDRSRCLDGKTIKNPTYEDFAPVVEYLLSSNMPLKHGPETPDTALFDRSDKAKDAQRQVAIMLEEIEGTLTSAAPGQSREEKKWKVDVLERAFSTRSWEKIKTLPLKDLKAGLSAIRKEIRDLSKDSDAIGYWKQEIALASSPEELDAVASKIGNEPTGAIDEEGMREILTLLDEARMNVA